MNVENMTKLRDHLRDEVNDNEFSMATYYQTDCGTVGCIAGYAVALLGEPDDLEVCVDHTHLFEKIGARVLGLPIEEAEGLFCATWSRGGMRDTTRQMAVDHLTGMIEKETKA